MRFWKDLPWLGLPASFVARGVKRAGDMTLDTVYPPQSLLTGAASGRRDIEGELWGALSFLDEPCCTICGFPFEFEIDSEALCGRCEARPPKYDAARAAFAYDDSSRKLVLDFKHGGRLSGVPVFATHMRRAGRALLEDADILVPVPLHRKRLRARRYNQAAILARALAKDSTAMFNPDILMRKRATESQGGKSLSGRRRNVMGAFAVRQSAKAQLKGKKCVLVDDVYTTGATLEACASPLKRAGVARVSAITLARVVKPQDVPT